MKKEVTEVVYGFHFTDKEFDSYYKKSRNNSNFSFTEELFKVNEVKTVEEFPSMQKSIYIAIQVDKSQRFSNVAQTCYFIIKNMIK